MNTEGIDYATQRPSPAAIVAAGKGFVGRYLSTSRGDARGITSVEAQGYLAVGLDIFLIWETFADRAAGGRAAGISDGQDAAYQLAAIGAPAGTAVYFVCQDDGTPPALASIDAYLGGCGSVIGAPNVGAYAGGDVLTHIKTYGSAAYLWRAAAKSWGAAPVGTHLIQYATGSTTPPAPPIDGQAVDLDHALVAAFGQWKADPPMRTFTITGDSGIATVKNGPNYSAIPLDGVSALVKVAAGQALGTALPIHLDKPYDAAPGDRQSGYLVVVGGKDAVVLRTDATFSPPSVPVTVSIPGHTGQTVTF